MYSPVMSADSGERIVKVRWESSDTRWGSDECCNMAALIKSNSRKLAVREPVHGRAPPQEWAWQTLLLYFSGPIIFPNFDELLHRNTILHRFKTVYYLNKKIFTQKVRRLNYEWNVKWYLCMRPLLKLVGCLSKI